MGTCWNCNTQLTLEDEQTKCDNCGAIINYICNNCKEKFLVEDKETKKKLKDCNLCGYFKCPNCDVCSWDCDKYKWERKILKILSPEVTQVNCPHVLEKVREVVRYFEDVKSSSKRMTCIKNVPITYAKSRVKSLLAKMEGFRVKDENDRSAFTRRLDEVRNLEVGKKLTVKQIREKGSYGQEYRDAFNLLVCLGKLKITWTKNKQGEEYALYERVEESSCRFLAQEDLIINECEKCKTRYPLTITSCDKCGYKKKGKNKGELFQTKKRLNNHDTCQMYRGDFIKDGKKLD